MVRARDLGSNPNRLGSFLEEYRQLLILRQQQMILHFKRYNIPVQPSTINFGEITKSVILLNVEKKNRRKRTIRQIQFPKVFVRNGMTGLTTQKNFVNVNKKLRRKIIKNVIKHIIRNQTSLPICV